MGARLSVWSDVECAGGTRIGAVPAVVAATQKMVLDQRHRLTIQAPRDHEWLDGITARDVLRVDTDNGDTYEWRVATMEDGRGGGEPVTTVAADPVAVELRDVGLIRDQQSGGVSYHNLGGVRLTPAQYIDSFVLTTLSDNGVTWVSRGTIDSTERIDVTWDAITPMELIDRLATKTGLEWQLRRNGATDYQVDLVTEIGSSLSSVLVAERRNLLSITRHRDRENLYTVISPFGDVPPESNERATIAQAVWKITAIAADTPSSGTDRVTLADVGGEAGPIAVDDQFVGNYLLAEDATLQEITGSSAANDTVDIGDASSFAVGDYVEIRKDSSGTYLQELVSPSGKSTHGRIVGTFNVQGARGERNFCRNPAGNDWATQPSGIVCQATASVSDTFVELSGLPANHEIKQNDQLVYYNQVVGDDTDNLALVTADVTADGSGNATVAASRGPQGQSMTNQNVYLYQPSDPPDGWTRAEISTHETDTYFRRDTTIISSTSCKIRVSTDIGGGEPMKLKNLSAGEEIQPGDTIEWANSLSDYFVVIMPATADGSGDVDVWVKPDGGSLPVTGVDDPVTITRPQFGEGVSFPQAIMLPAHAKVGGSRLETPQITIPFVSGLTTLWVRAQFTVVGARNVSTSISSPIWISLLDSGGSTLKSVTGDDFATGTAGTETHFINGLAYELTGDLTCSVRVAGTQDDGQFSADPALYVRWVSMTLGPDKRVPPVDGSHATVLWQEGNSELADRDAWPTTFRIALRELRELWDATPAEQQIMLGGTIRIKVPSMSIDQNVRVVELVYDLVNPENTQVTLDTRLDRLSSTTARQRPRPVFADINVETDASGEDQVTVSTTDDPPTVQNTRRSDDTKETDTTGEIPPKNYDTGESDEKYAPL